MQERELKGPDSVDMAAEVPLGGWDRPRSHWFARQPESALLDADDRRHWPGRARLRWLSAGAAAAIAVLIATQVQAPEIAPQSPPGAAPAMATAVAPPVGTKSSAPAPAKSSAPEPTVAKSAEAEPTGSSKSLGASSTPPTFEAPDAPVAATPVSEHGLGDWSADWPQDGRSLVAWAGPDKADASRDEATGGLDALEDAPSESFNEAEKRSHDLATLDPLFEAIEGTVAIQDEEIGARLEEAETLFAAGDIGRAAVAVRDVLVTDHANLKALRLYGRILMRERKFAPALEVLDAVVAAHPSDEGAQLERGTALLALGRPQEAAEAALVLGADSLAEITILSRARAAAGAIAEAISVCNRIGSEFGATDEMEWCFAAVRNQSGNKFVALQSFIATLTAGEATFVKSKQAALRDAGLFDGPVDGISDQRLIDAVASCAVARDCLL